MSALPPRAVVDGRGAAVDFLLRHQQASGAWVDFDLAPGESDSWVTAFVALVLVRVARLPDERRNGSIAAAVERAVAFLLGHARREGDGLPRWGYNDRVPPDADSTAHVALLLQALSHPEASVAGRALLAFRRDDGGFATFRRRSAADPWGRSHPDVTAVALRALAKILPADDRLLYEGLAYLRNVRQPDGLWPSFWWTTPLFATAAALRLFRDLGVSENGALAAALDRMEPPAAPFDQALHLAVFRLAGGDAKHKAALSAAIWSAQRPDGSWPSTARLRVTDPLPEDPALPSTGPAHRDQNRLYTTATVLHAIARP